jgi:hypothetical protein
MLVGFGQEICKPVAPRCDLCDVSTVPSLCPSARKVILKKAKEELLSPSKGKRRKVDADDERNCFVPIPRSPPKVEIAIEEGAAGVKREVKVEEDVRMAADGLGEEVVVLEEKKVVVKEETSPNAKALFW